MKNMNLIEKGARFVSGLLEDTGNQQRPPCVMILFGEPEYPIELLTEEAE